MPIDIAAAARAVGGISVLQGMPERTPVEAVTELRHLVVGGSHGYATLVTTTVPELLTRLERGDTAAGSAGTGDAASTGAGHDPLSRSVLVSDADTPELRDALAAHGIAAILGANAHGEALHARLTALLADDRAASDRLVAAGMKVLTQAARSGGVTAAIAELAHRVDGWAVLLDTQGQLIASAGAGRLHVTDAVAVALGRPVRIRHPGLQVHQVGSDRDLAGHLVIATRSSSTSHARDLASLAAALFDLLLRTHDASVTEQLGRESLVETLLRGGAPAAELLRRWGVHEPTLTAFALGAKTRTIDLERMVKRWLDELGAEYLFATTETGRAHGFVRNELVPELIDRVRAITPSGGIALFLGIGEPAPVTMLSRSTTQARQALDTAREDNRAVLKYAGIATVELALDSLSANRRQDLIGILDPLLEPGGAPGELARTLRVFLAEHGGQRTSAARLGIHRQTLASRLRRIEALTGLSLTRPDDRAVAWLALRAAGL